MNQASDLEDAVEVLPDVCVTCGTFSHYCAVIALVTLCRECLSSAVSAIDKERARG